VVFQHHPPDGAAPAVTEPVTSTCRAVAPPDDLVEARRAFPRLPALDEPVALAGPVNRRWYVIERRGRVRWFEARPDADRLNEVADLTAEVDPEGDAGLVGVALHPRFGQAGEGRLFLSYTALGGTVMRSRVISLGSPDGGASFPAASRRVIFDLDQTNPWRIHLNGDLRFGPDGYLYAGFGDGAPMGDPDGHAQDPRDYRGKILRVDVDHGDPYAVPASNPFLDQDAMPEVYALGFRNPWRFSFDARTGELWAGDVGAYSWEEIDRVSAGANLGWSIREGNHCAAGTSCDEAGLVAPVAEYGHDNQASAVVGGFVYHGAALPALAGRYVFADFSRGDVFALDAQWRPERIARTGRRITSFAEEPNGELLIVDLGGEILRLEPAPPPAELVAALLSQTGCFQALDPRQPAPGLLPYEVRVPFWSDGADKTRYLALPEGERATLRADGQFVLPVGSVLVKQFQLGGRPVETRLMMKYRESQWAGYSYAWDPSGTDARLVPEAGEAVLEGTAPPWSYPSRGNCLGCHNQDRALGLEVDQLDLDTDPAGNLRPTSTLARWRQAGLIEGQVPAIARLPRVDGKAPLEQRARAYLHANCSICHAPGGPTPVDLDLRFATSLAGAHLCGAAPEEGDLGVAGARRLVPGDPGRSLLALRMRAHGRDHMPPIGPQLVDDKGVALVEAWIRQLPQCP